LVAGMALWTSSCDVHHSHSGGGSGPPPPLVYQEREPNDDPFFGDFIGSVYSGSHLFIDGYVDNDPGPAGDIYDHFEFVTDEPASFEVRLEPYHTWSDVALGVFDPDTGQMVLWVDDPGGVQWADFTVHAANKSFVLVVAATYGAGSYELELLGHTYNPVMAAAARAGSVAPPLIEPLDPSLDLRQVETGWEVPDQRIPDQRVP
ncbi:MAG TPA: hypothetical protein P5218_07865, partial [Planctomycetota bacterium]|nr:hypothetical protein [Planctomycetota bacterium]